MNNASIEYYVDMANDHHDDDSVKNTSAIVLAREAMKADGATDEEIRQAMMRSRFANDPVLNLRATLTLIR